MPPLVSPRNDVWETSTEIPYWWCVITLILVVLLICRASTNQKHYSGLGSDATSVWNFCARFPDVISREIMMASWNVGCFLRLFPSSRLINTANLTGENLKNRLTWNESPTCSDGFVIKKTSLVGLPCSTSHQPYRYHSSTHIVSSCFPNSLWWIYFTNRNQVVTRWPFFLPAGTQSFRWSVKINCTIHVCKTISSTSHWRYVIW